MSKRAQGATPTGTAPIDGDSPGGAEQLARLCGNVMPRASRPPEQPAWVLPYVVTLRASALAYRAERRRDQASDPRPLAARVLEETQAKMNRWPVVSVLPQWLDLPLTVKLLLQLGTEGSLAEAELISWLSEPDREQSLAEPVKEDPSALGS